MPIKLTTRFTKPVDKSWMSDSNPGLRAQIDAAIESCSTQPGFLNRTVQPTETELTVVTICDTEENLNAYLAAKQTAIAQFEAQRSEHLALNSIVEQLEVRETI